MMREIIRRKSTFTRACTAVAALVALGSISTAQAETSGDVYLDPDGGFYRGCGTVFNGSTSGEYIVEVGGEGFVHEGFTPEGYVCLVAFAPGDYGGGYVTNYNNIGYFMVYAN